MHGHDRGPDKAERFHNFDAVKGEVQTVLNASDQFNLAKGTDAQSQAGQLFQNEAAKLFQNFQHVAERMSGKVDLGAVGMASAEQLLGPQNRKQSMDA